MAGNTNVEEGPLLCSNPPAPYWNVDSTFCEALLVLDTMMVALPPFVPPPLLEELEPPEEELAPLDDEPEEEPPLDDELDEELDEEAPLDDEPDDEVLEPLEELELLEEPELEELGGGVEPSPPQPPRLMRASTSTPRGKHLTFQTPSPPDSPWIARTGGRWRKLSVLPADDFR